MIFAAGLGTRMGELTQTRPKALVEVKGRPLIGHVLERVVAAGATRVVVNTCHFTAQIEAYLAAHAPAGVAIALSHEPGGPYDTGGGLAHAALLFRGDGPILLHNVDVLSSVPLDGLLAAHDPGAMATVAVQDRPTQRKMLFDDEGLMGWRTGADERRVREPRGSVRAFGFTGIHVIAPVLLQQIRRTGTFPIRDVYLDLAEAGEVIRPYDVTASRWLDVGTPERLREAELQQDV
jgi:N-acetyl-alpha-D-muramate 1-phosphate uridylyltransferase